MQTLRPTIGRSLTQRVCECGLCVYVPAEERIRQNKTVLPKTKNTAVV